jgi:DNA-binding winged helix-turn-helix (wHTH) protein
VDAEISTAAMRRQPFWLGPVLVKPLLNELLVGGRVARVEPRLMVVLTELAALSPSPATRDHLLGVAWPEDGADEALTLAISRLRRALGAEAGLIATIPKIGYRLTAAPAPLAPSRPAAPASRHATAQRAALVLALLVVGFWVGAYGAVWAHRDDFAGSEVHRTNHP